MIPELAKKLSIKWRIDRNLKRISCALTNL